MKETFWKWVSGVLIVICIGMAGTWATAKNTKDETQDKDIRDLKVEITQLMTEWKIQTSVLTQEIKNLNETLKKK